LDKNIAIAMIDIEFSNMGTQLVVDLGEKKVIATITSLPFIDNRQKYLAGL
jgi:glycine cleavage system aminomethyltransferase T